MDCEEIERLLGAYDDGELELTRQLDVEAHLAACPTCKKAAEAAANFRFSVRMNIPIYKAPPELKATIRAALRRESGSRFARFFQFRRSLAGAIGILALGVWFGWAWIVDSRDKDRELIAQAISNHSRSLLVDHLVDVTSSDQHTVKPWVTGKLDYSPPVADLSEAGYELVGGRIDLLENRPVAAIVYRYHAHFIDAFVWPAANHTIDFDVQSHQGYSLCGWNRAGLNFLILSELSQADIEKFEDQLRDRVQ
ncbi:MAG TPA: anti-sigma factor [Chthoniobacterales bacterium]|nr:anti-sigma factor [Chthoniobacterales bacterium]